MKLLQNGRFLTHTLFLMTLLLLSLVEDMKAQGNKVNRTWSCNAGGFIGTIKVTWIPSSSGIGGDVTDISYKIDKGGNSGGNKANIGWVDGGVAPVKRLGTSRGIQDNAYHSIGGSYGTGSGGRGAGFVFDKSLASDPRCTINNIRF
jgi:prepilin-type processing-associated H-X9-DG protein